MDGVIPPCGKPTIVPPRSPDAPCILPFPRSVPHILSCLQLLVCTLNLLVASWPLSQADIARLCQEHPGAVGADGRLHTLKVVAGAFKFDEATTKVSAGSSAAGAGWP